MRSRQLDFLRGIAILLVLAVHLNLEIPNVPILGPFFDFFNKIGWVGVDVFFVLSGFLVGGLLIGELNKYGTIDPKRFLIRRGLKIYPLYYVFFAYLFFIPLFKGAIARDSLPAIFSDLWTKYWPNLLFLNGYIGDNPIGHTWTLAIEEHFYLILPFFLLFLSKRTSVKSITYWCAAIFIPVFLFRSFSVYHPNIIVDPIKETHFRIDALFLGVAIRGFFDVWPHTFSRLREIRYHLMGIGYAGLACVPYMETQLKNSLGFAITNFASAAVLIGTYHLRMNDLKYFRQIGSRIVKWTCWIGTYSYSIYLWHVTFFRIIERQFENRLGYSPDAPWAMLHWIAAASAICLVTILLSALISRIVEIPILTFRDKLFPSRSTSIPNPEPTPENAFERSDLSINRNQAS